MSQHVLPIRTFDKSLSVKVIINAGERVQNDIFHDAPFVYPDNMYSSISPNTTVLPICFRISVFRTECPSPEPPHHRRWVVSWGSILRGATAWLVWEARWTGGKHPTVGLQWLPSLLLLQLLGRLWKSFITALCLCFPLFNISSIVLMSMKIFWDHKGQIVEPSEGSSNCYTYTC